MSAAGLHCSSDSSGSPRSAWFSFSLGADDFPESERATAEVLSIPVYPELEDEQIRYVAGLIQRFDG